MKNILILILSLLFSLNIFAQNGGQFFENNVIRLGYVGYSSGTHTFKIVNKQNCEVTIRTKADNDAAIDVIVSNGDSVYVNVFRGNPANIKFRVKAETSCPNFTNPDMGWLELNTSIFTLNLVESNNITIIRGPDKLNLLLNNGILKTSFGSRSYSQEIKIYTILGNIIFCDLIFVKRFNQTDLNYYLKSGLNIIEVTIVSGVRTDKFLFKYLKP
jgi:hypothetical protein